MMKRFVVGFCFLGALIGAMASEPSPAPVWPEAPREILREEILGIRFWTAFRHQGPKAGEKAMREQMRKHPGAPEVTAYAAAMSLLLGKDQMTPLVPREHCEPLLRTAAAAGSPIAKSVLGLALVTGADGAVSVDRDEGMKLLLEAAEQGDARAMGYAGMFLMAGIGNPKNRWDGPLWVRRAAARGHLDSMVALADGFETGGFGPPNLALAMQLYSELANYGAGIGWNKLAEYERKGVPGAERMRALTFVRFVHDGGWFAQATVEQHLATLEKFCDIDPRAQTEVAIAYLEGEHVKRNVTRARALLEQAVRKANEDAKFFLAYMRMRGLGGPAEPEAGLREMTALADAGNARAAARLGNYYYYGDYEARGFRKDPAKAFHYSRIAAQAGSFQGMCDLARCYEHGIGTRENYALAAKVYFIAGQLGYRDAHEKVVRHLAFAKVR